MAFRARLKVVAPLLLVAAAAVAAYWLSLPRASFAFSLTRVPCSEPVSAGTLCAELEIVNVGDGGGLSSCTLEPVGTTDARFENGLPTIEGLDELSPGGKLTLVVHLKPGGSGEVEEPEITCEA